MITLNVINPVITVIVICSLFAIILNVIMWRITK